MKILANNVREVFIARIASHHLIESKQCQRTHHNLPGPAAVLLHTVEAFDQQYVLAKHMLNLHWRDLQADQARQAHHDEFRPHDADRVVGGREFRHVLQIIRFDQRLWPRPTDRRTMAQSLVELWR
ncbi:hypothetical protein D3C85_1540950 [compost metagenome]